MSQAVTKDDLFSILRDYDAAIVRLNDALRNTAPAGSSVKTFQIPYTFAIGGLIAVASGDTDYIPPFAVPVAGTAGGTMKLARVRYRLNNGAVAGNQVSFKIQVNGADVAGFGTTAAPLVTPASANWAETNPADVALADNDSVALVITAVGGSGPRNLSVTVILERSV